jgi:hypothetical protein
MNGFLVETAQFLGGEGLRMDNPLLAALMTARPPEKPIERFLTISQFARAVGRRKATVYRDIRRGLIPTFGFGARGLRIPASFLEKAAATAYDRYYKINDPERAQS